MKKRDGWLLAFFMAVAAVLAIFMRVQGNDAGERVVVMIDGALFGEYRLSQEQAVDVENTFGANRIVIKNGCAYMETADCPDKYCMTYQPISKTNECIICLPHRLVVQVEGADGTGLDGIVR